jgi:hypothetical protein
MDRQRHAGRGTGLAQASGRTPPARASRVCRSSTQEGRQTAYSCGLSRGDPIVSLLDALNPTLAKAGRGAAAHDSSNTYASIFCKGASGGLLQITWTYGLDAILIIRKLGINTYRGKWGPCWGAIQCKRKTCAENCTDKPTCQPRSESSDILKIAAPPFLDHDEEFSYVLVRDAFIILSLPLNEAIENTRTRDILADIKRSVAT